MTVLVAAVLLGWAAWLIEDGKVRALRAEAERDEWWAA